MAPLLRLDQVGLQAAAYWLLQEISFAGEAGDRLALVGASGAGKTSLLRLLNRLNETTQGQILLEGQEIHQVPVLQLRQQVVLVGQESKLLGMTVQEALVYPLKLRNLPEFTIQTRQQFWMERLHLPQDWLNRTEVQLSVGQRQWVAIARALMTQPKILLMDEPTSALDAGRSHHLVSILAELTESQQTMILMANHQLDIAQEFCTRLLHLHQGRLVQDVAGEHVDWAKLKQTLIEAEVREAAEWDE
ncbi:ATP-binding cassette domain-containing protein [Phormidium tenue FACHB-886]|nr:ATP-binding cassette domain-containing protein [Phormidium tenue FACHB-886]